MSPGMLRDGCRTHDLPPAYTRSGWLASMPESTTATATCCCCWLSIIAPPPPAVLGTASAVAASMNATPGGTASPATRPCRRSSRAICWTTGFRVCPSPGAVGRGGLPATGAGVAGAGGAAGAGTGADGSGARSRSNSLMFFISAASLSSDDGAEGPCTVRRRLLGRLFERSEAGDGTVSNEFIGGVPLGSTLYAGVLKIRLVPPCCCACNSGS